MHFAKVETATVTGLPPVPWLIIASNDARSSTNIAAAVWLAINSAMRIPNSSEQRRTSVRHPA